MRLLPLCALFATLIHAATIKVDHAQLRSGCYSDSTVVATLEKGVPLSIRYAMAGDNATCYKIAVKTNAQTIEGYLSATDIDGIDDFDKARRDAAWLDMAQVMGALRSGMPSLSKGISGSGSTTSRAADLIEASQPAKALEILEPELRSTKDPGVLMLAGIASWRNDDSRKALEYWRASLDKLPNPDLERLYTKVEKETRNDQSSERVFGLKVVLRYDNAVINSDMAREMVAVLDHEYTRISDQLGCHAEERVVAIVQARDAYRKATQAAEWSGGQFDGRIHVPALDGQGLDTNMRRTLSHEIAHACLSMMGRWPSWLQEGVAQKLSGDVLRPDIRQKLTQMAQEKKLPRLANLGQDWSRMDQDHAVMAYALSLAAIDIFYQDYANYGIANLLRNPERLPAITADLDRRLGL
jgi:hypothetical protein